MFVLQQLSRFDGIEVYNMLQHIKKEENAFKNPVKDMPFVNYKEWLIQQDAWSKGEQLPENYVAQTCYWLLVDNIPVGFGKIRHAITEASKEKGGNIGYAISSEHRGKGYGTQLLRLLLKKADELRVSKKLLTIEKNNIASKRVVEKNGGKLVSENEYRWFYVF